MSEYTEQAEQFLAKHGLTFRAVYLDCKVNPLWEVGDAALSLVPRDVYRCTIAGKGRGRVSFLFWQSINGTEQSETPTAYDLLACIQKYDVGTLDDFCSEFGYDVDSIKTGRIYRAIRGEWRKVMRFFTNEELEDLQEIN